MKISHLWSIVAVLVLSLGSVGVEAQSARDAEVLVPLARGLLGEPVSDEQVIEDAVVEDLPAVVAPRMTADDSLAARHAIPAAYWLGFLSLCLATAGVLAWRRPAHAESRPSLPETHGEGRISLV